MKKGLIHSFFVCWNLTIFISFRCYRSLKREPIDSSLSLNVSSKSDGDILSLQNFVLLVLKPVHCMRDAEYNNSVVCPSRFAYQHTAIFHSTHKRCPPLYPHSSVEHAFPQLKHRVRLNSRAALHVTNKDTLKLRNFKLKQMVSCIEVRISAHN